MANVCMQHVLFLFSTGNKIPTGFKFYRDVSYSNSLFLCALSILMTTETYVSIGNNKHAYTCTCTHPHALKSWGHKDKANIYIPVAQLFYMQPMKDTSLKNNMSRITSIDCWTPWC